MSEFFLRLEPGEATRTTNVRKRMWELLEDKRNTLPGMGGTVWQAYNAATVYYQHEQSTRGGNDDERENNREYSTVYGTGANGIDSAMTLALEYV